MTLGVRLDMEWDEETMRRLRNKLKAQNSRVGIQLSLSADPVVDFVGWYGAEVAKTARRRAAEHTDTGRMGRSVGFRWEGTSGVVYTSSRYGGFVDRGTQAHWPPVRALEGWARRHGIPAFLVARKISREGTPKTDWLTGAFEETARRELAPGMARLAGQITDAWGRH